MSSWSPSGSRVEARRASTLVLVIGILALLVIIATSYVTRTHGGRVVAVAIQRAEQRENNARVIGDMIAQEIAGSLFVRPVDDVSSGDPLDSNKPRLPSVAFDADGSGVIDFDEIPHRYGVDPIDRVGSGLAGAGPDGFPDYPFNFAPYHVVPFTNWPGAGGDGVWPEGPLGGGNASPHDDAEWNPFGNPGFGDTRWLRDIEPLRWETGLPGALPGVPDALSHWRHMTNIARPDNAWRIVGDITDVGSTLVTELGIPYEQWLSVRPQQAAGDLVPILDPGSGNAVFKGDDDFFDRWFQWFTDYAAVYTDPQQVPPNFYRLSDLDGDGDRHDFFAGGLAQDRPESEFIPGTARHTVSRILADTDADGFTDAFWFLAPTPVEGGIRQSVAVSVVDNGAMLNANAATRFVRNVAGRKTLGLTPSALALVGSASGESPAIPVGFFDNPANHENPPGPLYFGNTRIHYDPDMWDQEETGTPARPMSYLAELGLITDFGINPDFPDLLTTQADRLLYWQVAGSRPFGATFGITPFTLADEIELRMFHGQNHPWIVSRFERAVQAEVRREFVFTPGDSPQFLHANVARKESSEYLDQLTNRELVADNRRKLTMYNGARNDLMPPWLWWRWDTPALPSIEARENFLAQSRTKLDLRELDPNELLVPPDGIFRLHDRLAHTLLLALTDGDENAGWSYYGQYSSPAEESLQDTRRLAAGLAANILARRDPDVRAPLVDDPATSVVEVGAIRLPAFNTLQADDPPVAGTLPADGRIRFLGLEPQPFLLEAFICHAYASEPLPDPPAVGFSPIAGAPSNFVDDAHEQSTIVVVQIANPFDVRLLLDDYRLRVFGQTIELSGMPALAPGTEEDPVTAIFFAADAVFEHDAVGHIPDFAAQWLDFVDIDESADDLHPNTLVRNVTFGLGGAGSGGWSTSRSAYVQVPTGQNAIELLRVDDTLPGGEVEVVVDRFDYEDDHDNHDQFGEAVEILPVPPKTELPEWQPLPLDSIKPGIRIGTDDYWVTWARVTRAWGVDFNWGGGRRYRHTRYPAVGAGAALRVCLAGGDDRGDRVRRRPQRGRRQGFRRRQLRRGHSA